MSLTLVAKAVEQRMQAQFPPLHPTVPMRFDNIKFEQPAGQPWIDVVVRAAKKGRADLGTNFNFRTLGVINVTCMTPENSGNAQIRTLVDSVSSILLDKVFPVPGVGSITTYAAEIRDRGVINGWRTMNVVVEWRAFTHEA